MIWNKLNYHLNGIKNKQTAEKSKKMRLQFSLHFNLNFKLIRLCEYSNDSIDANSTLRTQAIRVLPGLGAGAA